MNIEVAMLTREITHRRGPLSRTQTCMSMGKRETKEREIACAYIANKLLEGVSVKKVSAMEDTQSMRADLSSHKSGLKKTKD